MTSPKRDLSSMLDRFSDWTGRTVSWLSLALVLVTFLVVLLRYVFNIGAITLQELLLYFHSLIFMLGAAYTLKNDQHVRVDIFYRPASPRHRAWVDLLGVVFLLWPSCGFIFYISWEYVASSWRIFEGSREAGGIDAVFLLKSLILLMPLMLILQGLALALRSFACLKSAGDTA